MQPRTNRIALTLFTVYLVLYGGFVFLNAYSPAAMEATPFAGVNLAILYGFGLIISAFLLALAYGWLLMGRPDRDSPLTRSTAGTGEPMEDQP